MKPMKRTGIWSPFHGEEGPGLIVVLDRPGATSLDADALGRIGCLHLEAELARHPQHGSVFPEHLAIERADASRLDGKRAVLTLLGSQSESGSRERGRVSMALPAPSSAGPDYR
jgi:hypothetical protein